MNLDYQIYEAGNVRLQSGLTFRGARLAYKTYGRLNSDKSNVIVHPTSFGAQHTDAEWAIREGSPLDPAKYFIVVPNLFGNGLSSSPSNTGSPFDLGRFPNFTLVDNVVIQQRMLKEVFGIDRIAMVYGFSMGGQQALHWGALFPEQVSKIVAVCSTAKLPAHAWVMFEGVKAALTADAAWRDGWFYEHPVRGLRAMGRVYAGWGFSQDWYREGLYRNIDAASSLEDFLVSHYEARFLNRNANDIMAMIWTLQQANVSRHELFNGDMSAALGAIRASVLAMPSESDLYFPVEDVRREVALIPRAQLCSIPSVWGHRAGNPQSHRPDANFIFQQVRQFMAD